MRLRLFLPLLLLVGAFLGAATAHAAVPARASASESELLAAREAAQRGQPRTLEAWRAHHPDHPLEPYAHYWLLAGALDTAPVGEVRAFLGRNAATPLAESLRREWLKALAARGEWDDFRAELSGLAGGDAEITCHALRDRLVRAEGDAAGEARALFNSAREAPEACDPLFAALVADKRLAEDEVWSRIRRLLAVNRVREARRTNTLLATRAQIAPRALERAAADPAAFLAREKSPLVGRGSKEVVVFAVTRLARNRTDEAAERLALLEPRLGSEATRFAWGQLAYQAAMNHHPRTLAFYEAAGDAAMSETQVAWRARAALRAGNWKETLAAIKALPPEEARAPAWRYWRARAWKELGDAQAASAMLQGLARELGFYGLLAAEEVGTPPAPDWHPTAPAAAEIDAVRALPGIRRALALFRIGFDNDAVREWLWAIRGLDDRRLLAAAELARLEEIPDRAIGTADRTVQIHDFAQRYPVPHREALAEAARQWGLDEAMVYSIIRQESRFRPEARSGSGASGLMQLMPATARWVARQIPISPYRHDMLGQPGLNIRMGTYYFRRVLDALGHPILAAAAYNAGPGRARRWRDDNALEGAIYVETIPFNETRDYVKKVLANAWFYRHRLDGKAPSLRQLLGTVAGRSADAAGAVAANLP